MRCSVAALDEPLLGTATHASKWIIVEHPGPWPRNALDAAGVDTRLVEWDQVPDCRVVLARHPERRGRQEKVWLFDADHHRLLAGGIDLLDHVASWIDGGELHGASPEAVAFVCAHAKRDQCCAIEGRRVVEGNHAQVWECSHLGGHRFAPTAVLFPHGLHLGRFEASTLVTVLNSPLNSSPGLDLDPYLRGDVRFEPRQQVAAATAARTWDCAHQEISAVALLLRTPTGSEVYRVSRGASTLDVEIVEYSTVPRLESCGREPTVAPTYQGRIKSACE